MSESQEVFKDANSSTEGLLFDGMSYVKGPLEPPIWDFTIAQALMLAASKWPESEALVSCHQNARLSWRGLATEAGELATGLLDSGLQPGDRIGIWAPNCVEWTLLQFATARAGLILVNINPAYKISELEYVLNRVGARAVVCGQQFKSSNYVQMMEAVAPELADSVPGALHAERVPHLRLAINLGPSARKGWKLFSSLKGKLDEPALKTIEEQISCNDAINIQFTSGTTGLPKGATLSHRNILNNAVFVGRAMGLKAGDRLCIPVPLYHCFGMVMGNLACMAWGATMVYSSEGFDALSVLRTVEREKCTALFGVPTMYISELEHPQFTQFDLSSLRTGLMAGSPCPIEIMRKVMTLMHMVDVGIAYGMTETSPVSFQTALDAPIERKVSTVGQIQPHLEAKVVDSSGAMVPRGQPGELCVRGYSVMLGYWDDPERTREVVDKDGWMHTGDLATIDSEGYCNIVGRIKDMLIRGGENIYPGEIEQFLFKHPKIEMVQIVGVPDQKYGEEVCAWIKLREGHAATHQEIIEFCDGQIAHYKVPRYIKFVDEFPLTVTGKVQKYLIREVMILELGLSETKTA